MKKGIVAVVIILTGFGLFAQNTAKDVLETELIKMLQSDRILLNQQEKECTGDCSGLGLWKNDKQKKKTLKRDEELKGKLLNKFNPPFYINDGIIKKELTFTNKSIGLIGSYIIRNNDLTVINREITPILPVMSSGNQTSILNPKNSGSSYVLNYNANNLFEGSLDANASAAFREYYQMKLQLNTNLTSTERSQISIGAGVFDNQLALIFDNTEQITSAEFEPLYYLWLEHKNGNIQPGDKIIKAFEGLCYFTYKGVETSGNLSANGNASSAANLPFVRYDIRTNSSWTNSNKFTTQQSIYNVYMFREPELTDIPDVNKIMNCWNRLKSDTKPEFVSTNLIPSNSPLFIKVKFGPVPNMEALSSIKLDEKYTMNSIPKNQQFIKSIKLITTDPNRITYDNEYYYFIIEVERNETFLTQNFSSLSHIIKTELPFRIYYNNPIGNDTLDIVYDPIEVQTERYPTPISDYELKPEKVTNKYEYKTTVRFNTANQDLIITNIPKPPKVVDVFGLPKSIETDFMRYITDASFYFKNLNEYSMTFDIPIKNNFFNLSQPNHDVVLVIEFYANNGTSYKRKLPIKLMAPPEQLQGAASVPMLIKNNEELLLLLNRNAIINAHTTIGDILDKYDVTKNQDNMPNLIKELKSYEVLSSSILGYLVAFKYLDISKMKK